MGTPRTVKASPIWRGELPHSLEAERALIGLALTLAAPPPDAPVAADDFYQPAHEILWRGVLELDAAGQRPDLTALLAWLESKGEGHKLKALGGATYLAELLAVAVSPEIAPFHARIVVEAAQKRRVIAAASAIPSLAVTGDDGWQAESERLLLEATASKREGRSRTLAEILPGVSKSLDQRYRTKSSVTGIPSGFRGLDAMTAGFQPSDLVIIAARPSMGKTALAMNAVAYAIGAHKTPALVFSLEMSKEQLVERLIASDSETSLGGMRTGCLALRDWQAISACMGRLSTMPLWIDDDADVTLTGIRRKARRWAALSEVAAVGRGIIVLDYPQLLSSEGVKADNRDREVAAMSRGLKALARELRMPVVALSQLNRSCEARADKRPTLADLRDSGAIEQDADVIAMIYRDEVYNRNSPARGLAEVIIAKQRNGPTGCVTLGWDAQFTRFFDVREERPA